MARSQQYPSPTAVSVSPPAASSIAKPPQSVLEGLWAFAPNRDTLGGTAYFLKLPQGNWLIDAPAWHGETQAFIEDQGGLQGIFLTHRGAFGKAIAMQQHFNCDVIVQEQEAYLLPGAHVTTFEQEQAIAPGLTALWTCGHSPGSACLYWEAHGGVLFTGRHLLPTREGGVAPLRTAKTFHWPRQLRHTQLLCDRFNAETLVWICPGASSGFLRGRKAIASAYAQLQQLDWAALSEAQPLL